MVYNRRMKNTIIYATRYTVGLITLGIFVVPTVVFAYQAAPEAYTKTPTFVTEKSAQLNASVRPNEMPDNYVWFEWGISGREGTVYETKHNIVYGGNTFVDVQVPLIGLAPSTQYFYRVISESSRGKDVGITTYFTTKALETSIAPIALVETRDTGFVNESQATLKGYVSPHGEPSVQWWFQWGTTMNFDFETSHNGFGSGSGPVEVRLNNLTSGTAHYYRLVAETPAGRTYGATKTFVTPGLPPPASETPRAQAVTSPVMTSDGITRRTTSSGSGSGLAAGNSSGQFNNSGDTTYGLPGASLANLPGNIFGSLFNRGAKPAGTEGTAVGMAQEGNTNVANVASSPMSDLLNSLLGRSKASIAVEKIGPKTITLHTTVEYHIAYRYTASTPAKDAAVKVTLPHDVVYIGDNTNNELLLQEGGGGERTYVLPVGIVQKGDEREFSILGMTTGAANVFPEARARFEWTDSSGTHVVTGGSGVAAVGKQTASAASADKSDSGWSILPTSLLGWVAYVFLLLLILLGVRKAREYYEKRKEQLLLEENENPYDPEMIARLVPQKPMQQA